MSATLHLQPDLYYNKIMVEIYISTLNNVKNTTFHMLNTSHMTNTKDCSITQNNMHIHEKE